MDNGLFQSPNSNLVMSTVSKDKLGIAGSVNGLIRNAGMVFGVSFSSVLLWSIMSKKVGYKVLTYVPGHSDAFTYSMHWVFFAESALCMIGVILTGIRIWNKKNRKENLEVLE